MKESLISILVCPECSHSLKLRNEEFFEGEIKEGELLCLKCNEIYPIQNYIPRFISSDNYSSSFGFQWNKFKASQIDKFNHTTLSKDRFFNETKWNDYKWSKDDWILDVGCGAGRFVDSSSTLGANVVAVDISNSVDACFENFGNYKNINIIQASVFKLPFKKGFFQGVYCIGVIQHTPDPKKVIVTLPEYVKKNGYIALTIYPKHKFTLLYMKYLIRPFTKRLPKKFLYFLIKFSMPFLFIITEVLFRIPVFGKFFKFLIPVANYVDEKQLSFFQRYDWAFLDTFDMLSPTYDFPQVPENVVKWISEVGVKDAKHIKPGSYIGHV